MANGNYQLSTMGSLTKTNNNVMPCAACKLLRRRCTPDCIFLPHFPSADPEKFLVVHRIFGASNVSKMLREIPTSDREDAVTSMVYEAKARVADPVYGCVGLVASLQSQISNLQSELNTALAETMALKVHLSEARATPASLHDSAFVNSHNLSHHQFGGYDSILFSPVMDYNHIDEFASDGLFEGVFPTFKVE